MSPACRNPCLRPYRRASLIRNCFLLGLYSRSMVLGEGPRGVGVFLWARSPVRTPRQLCVRQTIAPSALAAQHPRLVEYYVRRKAFSAASRRQAPKTPVIRDLGSCLAFLGSCSPFSSGTPSSAQRFAIKSSTASHKVACPTRNPQLFRLVEFRVRRNASSATVRCFLKLVNEYIM